MADETDEFIFPMNIRVNMETETAKPMPSETVMASIDDGGDAPRLIIADVERDDAWVSMPEASALSLARYR